MWNEGLWGFGFGFGFGSEHKAILSIFGSVKSGSRSRKEEKIEMKKYCAVTGYA